jgi:hypothetical protein
MFSSCSQWPRSLRACSAVSHLFILGFRIPPGDVCSSAVGDLCSQVQWSPTECGASLSVI